MTPESAPQDEATDNLVDRLRSEVVPAATQGGDAVAYVSGQTAAFKDIGDRIMERLPLFLLYVVGVTFILLAMAFRSVVISLTAAITTILSAFAAFGVLTLVVQEGHLLGLTGLDRTGPIETFVPPIAFAILFGLSMDYMVFIMSRIREEHVHGMNTRAAVEHGISAIGRVVVAAALIMGTVFAAFVLSGDRVSKEFGILLAVAILIDALLVRMTLVPSFLTLLGERSWYIPAGSTGSCRTSRSSRRTTATAALRLRSPGPSPSAPPELGREWGRPARPAPLTGDSQRAPFHSQQTHSESWHGRPHDRRSRERQARLEDPRRRRRAVDRRRGRDRPPLRGLRGRGGLDRPRGARRRRALRPDLIVLDWMLPDIDGIEVGRRLRERGHRNAILFLTAKDAVENKVEALRAGGDDYVTKPFSLAEVVARVQAILRRTGGDLPGDVLRFGDLVLDESRHEVFRGETQIQLTATEFALLRYFMLNPRRVLSKGQILQNVWRYDFGGNANVVETYVSYLRRKLDVAGPPLIKTVRQAGYMLEAAE